MEPMMSDVSYYTILYNMLYMQTYMLIIIYIIDKKDGEIAKNMPSQVFKKIKKSTTTKKRIDNNFVVWEPKDERLKRYREEDHSAIDPLAIMATKRLRSHIA